MGPLATPASAATTVIEDNTLGTGLNQVSYSGAWIACGGCSPPTPNSSFRYASDYGAIATIRFTGTQVNVFGIKERNAGFAAFTIDNDTPVVVDLFALVSVTSVVYSRNLAQGEHTLRITNLHLRNPAAGNYTVGFDRAEVVNEPPPPPPPLPVPTARTIEDGDIGSGLDQVTYAGTWYSCGGCVPMSLDNSFRYSSVPGATATLRFTGTQINIYGIKERHGGFATVSVDGGPLRKVDTYAPTSSVTLSYSSEILAPGAHTLVIRNVAERNIASDGNVVGFDRAEITAGATPPPVPPVYAGPRSGKPWQSGVNGDPVMDPTSVDAFCNWRGLPCDFAHVYVSRDNWSAVERPTDLLDTFKNWPGRLVLSVPPFPEGVNGSNAICATGAYDAHFRTFGQTLNSYGRQDSIVRLAWEGNGNWYQWSATNPTDYVNCWRHVVDAINATSEPDPTLVWTLNSHYSQNPPSHNALDIYPGDFWVDVIGLDSYDHWPPSRTKAEFDKQAQDIGGITYYYNFARAHNKLFGVGEWGVVSGSGTAGGGDSSNYVQWMSDWFVERANRGMLYEFYFNNCERDNVGSNLFRPLSGNCYWRNPNAGQRYQQLW